MSLRVMAKRISPLLAAAALLGTSCALWTARPQSVLAAPHGERDLFQVWVAGRAYLLHGLTVEGDTVSGVPEAEPTDCQACRVRLALAGVDSVRVPSTAKRMGLTPRTVLWSLVLSVALVLVLPHVIAAPG